MIAHTSLVAGLLLAGCAAKGVIWGEISRSTVPIPNARLTVVDQRGDIVHRAVANERGRFEVRGLTSGTYRVEADVDAGALAPDTSASVTVEIPRNDGIRNASISLLPAELGASVTGLVVDQFGRGVASARVCSRAVGDVQHCTLSRGDGSFSLPWVLAGVSASISAQPEERTDDTHRTSETIKIEAGASDVVLRMDYRPSLKLRVVDEDGRSIPTFHLDDRVYTAPVSTRDWHRDRPLEIAADGYATEFVSLPSINPEGDVDGSAVVLTRGELVRGTVVDADTGKPIVGADVLRPGSLTRLRTGSHTWCGTCAKSWAARQLAESTTDSAGRFAIRLTPTQRDLVVSATDYREVTVRREGTELVVKLQRLVP